MSVGLSVLAVILVIEFDIFGQNLATDFKRNHEGLVNLSSVVIPSGSEITDIYLNGNNLVRIPHGYFTNLSLPNLKKIHLGTNKISQLDDNWLSGMTSLQTLYLVHNHLKIIRNQTFSGLTSLRILTLNVNRIVSIGCGSFWDLRALTELKLERNELQTLHECVFDLQAHPAALDLYLYDNPWICNEELSWLVNGFDDWITLRDDGLLVAECSSPPVLTGCELDALTTDILKSAIKHSEYTHDRTLPT